MTRALYHDPHAGLTFSSVVTQLEGQEAALEATAFYPTSGGQNDDHGHWRWPGGEARVVATRKDKATGTVWHRLEGELPPPGTEIVGAIEAGRRWRHMQRHSAEHLLAQAFVRVNPAFQVAAVSMLGPECHLDLLGDPGPSHVQAAERLLRETLGRDELTLQTPVVPEAELGQYGLRRESKVRGQVWLVMFVDRDGRAFDVSACGGTHVPRAAMCAPVVILRTERIKGGLTRVTFMAGEEASEYLAGVYQMARQLAQRLSVPVGGVPERFEAQSAELERQREESAALRVRLAQQLVAASEPQTLGQGRVRFVELDDPQLLPPVLTAVPAGEVLVALGAGGRCGVASAQPGIDAAQLLREVLAETGGKGGGRPDLAQGNTADPAAFLKAAHLKLLGEGLN